MKNEYELFGKDLKKKVGEEKDKKTAEEVAASMVEENWEKAIQPIEGELEKSSEEIKFIELINRCIKDELEELEIKKDLEIIPEQLHFFSREDYLKNFPDNKDDIANHNVSLNAAFFYKIPSDEPTFYKAIAHEMIHIASCHKFYVETEKNRVNIESSRTGYNIFDPRKKNDEYPEHFKWFNEAVVDKITPEIIAKHGQEIQKILGIDEKELTSTDLFPYSNDLNNLIKELAKEKKTEEKDIWRQIKKGEFTGEMMHLRDIEKYFGEGELERLANPDNKK